MKHKVLLRGAATVTGTRNYFDTLKIFNDKMLKNPSHPGWYFSGFGFGTYRTHIDNKDHANALKYALTKGINVIDTASNYMDGLSEELAGNILKKIFIREEFERENYIVITKGGYIQGTLLAEISINNDLINKYPGITRYNEQLWHCMDKEFIEDQIEASRNRLGLSVIDVYLLHNPEYFVFGRQKSEGESFDPEMADFLLYQEMKKGFIALEEAVQKKHIQFYGISSNTITVLQDVHGYVDLNRVLIAANEAAEAVWGKAENHHFAFVQFPFNLVESQAAYGELIDDGKEQSSIFQFCEQNNIVMLTNRPFNATLGDSLLRLAKPISKNISEEYINTEKSFEQFIEAENLLLHFLLQHNLENLPVGSQKLKDLLGLSPILRQYIGNLENLDQYNQFIFGFVLHKLNMAKSIFIKALSPAQYKEGVAIFEKYGKAFSFLAEDIKNSILQKMIKKIEPIEEIVNKHLPEKYSKLSLAQKTLLTLRSAHFSLIALNGMRQTSYVKEALSIMGLSENLPNIDFLPELTKDILKHYHR
ncbi:MAG: aldo/keto reductase [Calditrichia bacterium]|nr:aldo/keto reductase [Calditrichia bacterium]